MLVIGDNLLNKLDELEENCYDSIISEPFNSSRQDLLFSIDVWKKCYRVLKPGAHLMVFCDSKEYHHIVCAIEDAGFEIRDCIMYLHKSNGNTDIKPALEPIVVARKQLEGSCVENVIKWGVGGIDIDGCRVKTDDYITNHGSSNGTLGSNSVGYFKPMQQHENTSTLLGRFPANMIHDGSDEVVDGMPYTKSGSEMSFGSVRKQQLDNCYKLGFSQKDFNDGQYAPDNYGDGGSASRYFKTCEFSEKDNKEGLNPTELLQYIIRLVSPKNATILNPFDYDGNVGKAVAYENLERNSNYNYVGILSNQEQKDFAENNISDAHYIEPKNEETLNETKTIKKNSENVVELW